jgi:hypothetical protein
LLDELRSFSFEFTTAFSVPEVMMQLRRKTAFQKFILACALSPNMGLYSQQQVVAQDHRFIHGAQADDTLYFPLAQFKIPFNVESTGTLPSQVQLWVSTDEGATWQMHGSATADRRAFEFRAAAEGLYLFSVRTLDDTGRAFPSPQPPMRVLIDTTKPYVELRADVNASGQVVVDVKINEAHLKTDSVRLRYRTDQQSEWSEVPVTNLVAAGHVYEGQVTLDIKQCREVGFVVTVADEAANIGDATYHFSMPRTASINQDMMLASQRNGSVAPGSQGGTAPSTHAGVPAGGQVTAWQGSGLVPTPGAVVWPVDKGGAIPGANRGATGQPSQVAVTQLSPPQASTPSPAPNTGGWSVSGQLAGAGNVLNLGSSGSSAALSAEELPAPPGFSASPLPRPAGPPTPENPLPVSRTPRSDSLEFSGEATRSTPADLESTQASTPFGQAFHCNSRAFSLDYALNEVAGSALADVELWGTEDGGRIWQRWGSDPDRQSPFDVQVANDGLFGFRMVIVSQNGTLTNRPKDGDSADAWINVDTAPPSVKITRAVYGEGHEAGLLVLDYTCSDANLHDRPLTLSYSETLNGPWVTITTGLKNTGIYLWKPPANLPEHVFLKVEAVDRAGNIGTHRLDLPINVQGLAPRGRIQGFRPINNP